MNFVIRFTALVMLLALGACGGGGGSNEVAPPASNGGNNNPPPPVVTAPTITTQPVSASANEGGTVTFTVVASGDGLSYQWKRSGTAIAGATAASYTTPPLAAADDQSLYSATVTNAGGSVTSNNAVLTVTPPPPPPPPPPPAGGGGDDGSLQPLSGPADPFPQTPAPVAATPTIAGVTLDHRYLLSWDPSSSGLFTFGFLHYSGAETRLYVPVGAFLDDAWITTADVTSVGASVTSVVAAIDIEPGDYVTEKTITANFMIPDAMMATIDPAQLIGFAADSDGSNLHMVPIVVGNFGASITRPAIKLDHLGIVGIAVATPEQQAALAAAWPTDPGDQLIAALAPALTQRWRNAVTPAATFVAKAVHVAYKGIAPASDSAPPISAASDGDPATAAATDGDPVTTALRGYYNDAVVPAFAAADADPSVALAAISAGMTFLRMAELSGQAGTDGAFAVVAQQVSARISSLLDAYASYVAGQCRSLGGPGQLQQMLGTMRLLQLMGHQAKSDEIEDVLPQCSNYKVAFRFDYTRTANWSLGYTAGDVNGIETVQEHAHVVIEGEHTFGLNSGATDAQLRMTTLDWTEDRSRDNSQTFHSTWASEGVVSPWRINGVSVPVIRTRGGTPPTSITLYLSPFVDPGPNSDVSFHPFTATVTTKSTNPDGSSASDRVDVHTGINLEIFVPALPGDGAHNYGAMLIPRSGGATSSATRTTPYHGGSIVESESVTVTISRPD
ncbi:MAG: hypothetical protein WDO68_02040 [Gammaproteobacteria bacterium]